MFLGFDSHYIHCIIPTHSYGAALLRHQTLKNSFLIHSFIPGPRSYNQDDPRDLVSKLLKERALDRISRIICDHFSSRAPDHWHVSLFTRSVMKK